jgi:hypothetical protein
MLKTLQTLSVKSLSPAAGFIIVLYVMDNMTGRHLQNMMPESEEPVVLGFGAVAAALLTTGAGARAHRRHRIRHTMPQP